MSTGGGLNGAAVKFVRCCSIQILGAGGKRPVASFKLLLIEVRKNGDSGPHSSDMWEVPVVGAPVTHTFIS